MNERSIFLEALSKETPAQRSAYLGQAVQWLEKNSQAQAKNRPRAEALRRFRSEAEEVLELTKK